jgi:hypothetical protein
MSPLRVRPGGQARQLPRADRHLRLAPGLPGPLVRRRCLRPPCTSAHEATEARPRLRELRGPAAKPRNVLLSPCEVGPLHLAVLGANSAVWPLRCGAPGPCGVLGRGADADRSPAPVPSPGWHPRGGPDWGSVTAPNGGNRSGANDRGGAFRPALTGLPSRRHITSPQISDHL